MSELTLSIAVLAGFLSFLSPCILPVIPGFMAYISGDIGGKTPTKTQIFMSSVFFVFGFSIVFALLGVLLNTTLSAASDNVKAWLSRIGGLIIILFGFQVLGLLQIPLLSEQHRPDVKRFSSRYLTAFLFGSAFAVGWSPCVGTILGSIFALAVSIPSAAFGLLLAYSIGLGLPFLLLGLFTDQAMTFIRRSEHLLRYFNIMVGVLLLILGILVFTENLSRIYLFLPRWNL